MRGHVALGGLTLFINWVNMTAYLSRVNHGGSPDKLEWKVSFTNDITRYFNMPSPLETERDRRILVANS